MRPGASKWHGLTDTAAGAGHESDFAIKVKQVRVMRNPSCSGLEAGALDDLEAHVLQQVRLWDELGAFVLRLAVVEAVVVDLLDDACQTEYS